MTLPLPKPSSDRPRRPVTPSPHRPHESPARTYGFDRDAARQAWRQVARTRGAHAMRLGGRESEPWRIPLAIGLVAVAAFAGWVMTDDSIEPVPASAVTSPATAPTSPPTSLAPPDQPAFERPAVVEPPPMVQPQPAGAPTFAPPPSHEAPPPPRSEFVATQGTPADRIEALKKLPHASTDRAPIGGIGPDGLHIDRITMGTRYENGGCRGPVGQFSRRDESLIHVCFRAVHPRIEQDVIVLWERDGEVTRRTFVTIGDSHGYRTRAGLRLRKGLEGPWVARVMSSDGVELASHSFQIL